MRRTAAELAEHARLSHLVLFIGSGASVDAGVPTWRELIASVATKAGLEGTVAEKLQALDPRDAATVLQRRTGTDAAEVRKLICDEVNAVRGSLTHALLASLRTREGVTTNYDQLFEITAHDASDPLAVLPFDRVRLGQRWLLKLHGGVDHPESIVFTRDDYLGAAASYGALYGLLQALLMTKAMLFVGYSLSDEDFHAVMNEVTRVLARAPRGAGRDFDDRDEEVTRSIARVLTLEEDLVFDDIWSPVTTIIPMSDTDERLSKLEEARRMQIFLDLVGFEAAETSEFLLDDTFAALLDREEVKLRDALRELEPQAQRSSSSEAWEPVRQLLRRYGADL